MAPTDPTAIADRESLLEACHSVLRREGLGNIQAVFLYGSSLEGNFRPDSDIDIAVLDDVRHPLSWSEQARLMDALERALGHGVDLRVLRESSPSHQAYVLQKGRLVWSRDPHLVDRYFRELRSAIRSERELAEQEWPRVLDRLANR